MITVMNKYIVTLGLKMGLIYKVGDRFFTGPSNEVIINKDVPTK